MLFQINQEESSMCPFAASVKFWMEESGPEKLPETLYNCMCIFYRE